MAPTISFTMEMAKYILAILRSQLMIVFSWGFHSAMAIENGLAFRVQGYKHQGRVEVLYDEGYDLFRVRLLNPDGSVKQEQDGIYLDCLVSVIDGMVERTDDYSARVRKQYGL